MRLQFDRAGIEGTVEVEVGVNGDQAALGCPDYARGFPCCRATVSPPARGYADFLGWVQLVSSTDLYGEFRIDPFEPLGEPTHPLCFYGFAPVLFDAPHREHRDDTDFVAHSFLCGLAGGVLSGKREIEAILGFSWGFRIRQRRIEIDPPNHLEASDWDGHLAYLRASFPGWSFRPGFCREVR
jgi:hypothetical protein